MKGTLNKHKEGWLVRYGDMQFLPLHPDFIEMMDTCFTSKFTQVVEFEMVLCSHSKSKDDYYAKLINHSVESNEMIEFPQQEISDESWEGCDGCTEQDEIMYKNGYAKGYNAAIGELPKEISDKVLFEQATVAMESHYGYGCETEIDAYFRGAKWMQKQLKGGQDEN
jgi:hypothetical protein